MARLKKYLQLPLAVVLLLVPVVAFAQSEPVGKVISIIGTVEVQSGGDSSPVAKGKEGEVRKVSFGPWSKVKPNQAVYATDNFKTARKSRLKILFTDKSLMALGPNTSMTVESYLYKPEEKLRQGVIKVSHGLSMYIVNKGQKNPKSSFKMVTPTGNVAARGTKGFLSVSDVQTLVANQAGSVEVNNQDPKVLGEIIVGAMMKSVIELGKPPTNPTPLTKVEVNQIQNVVMAWLQSKFNNQDTADTGGGEGKVLVELEEGDYGEQDDFREFYDLFDDILSESCTS